MAGTKPNAVRMKLSLSGSGTKMTASHTMRPPNSITGGMDREAKRRVPPQTNAGPRTMSATPPSTTVCDSTAWPTAMRLMPKAAARLAAAHQSRAGARAICVPRDQQKQAGEKGDERANPRQCLDIEIHGLRVTAGALAGVEARDLVNYCSGRWAQIVTNRVLARGALFANGQ